MRTVGVAVWRLGERLGIDVMGAVEGPPLRLDAARHETLDRVVATAEESGTLERSSCPYPVHELLTHLVVERRLLLHGSNHRTLEVLNPQPSRDFDTELTAVVACDDAIWPLFYATVDRDRAKGVASGCTHLGRPPRQRRLYYFALHGDPGRAETWTSGAVYVLPRAGFRREWGNEWVNPSPVTPLFRVPVEPRDFPLRDAVVGLARPEEFNRLPQHLRTAKRQRRAAAEP
jgi:hypothetical protein